MKTLIAILVLALIMPAIGMISVEQAAKNMNMRTDLISDPWMNSPNEGATKPVHSIDGSNADLRVATLNTINQLDSESIKMLQKTHSNNSMANLGGIGMASLDSNSFVPGGYPALKTTDPTYLEMGAQNSGYTTELPLILQGV